MAVFGQNFQKTAIVLLILHASIIYTLEGQLHPSELHPWAGEDLSLKIDERDQTIWICILEL